MVSTITAAVPARSSSSTAAQLAQFSFEDLVERIRAEFLEQPGLRLTEAQASRLWQLDRGTCEKALGVLTSAAFLTCAADGRYSRRSTV
jgi:hypothetical protein